MDSLPNNIGWILGILPAIAVLVLIKGNAGEPWRISNFISGWLLIGLATMMVGLLTEWGTIFEFLKDNGKITQNQHETIKSSSSIWLAVFPATFGGIGVNVVTEWLLSKRP